MLQKIFRIKKDSSSNEKLFDINKFENNLLFDFIIPREFLLVARLPKGNLSFFYENLYLKSLKKISEFSRSLVAKKMKKRKTIITRNYLLHPAGSVLIQTGNTKVICTATVQEGVPPFLLDKNQGWITAEYSMLPGAPDKRFSRESVRGKLAGRTVEIQRLIGRSLRAVVDMNLFPGYTILIDCDVIQADGGTRTAAITGACVALNDAFQKMQNNGLINKNPLKEWVAAISVGIVNEKPVLDLDYELDSKADVDMNIVMTESGKFVEIQGTAESNPFSDKELYTRDLDYRLHRE